MGFTDSFTYSRSPFLENMLLQLLSMVCCHTADHDLMAFWLQDAAQYFQCASICALFHSFLHLGLKQDLSSLQFEVSGDIENKVEFCPKKLIN